MQELWQSVIWEVVHANLEKAYNNAVLTVLNRLPFVAAWLLGCSIVLVAKRILCRELNEFSSFLVSKYALGEA